MPETLDLTMADLEALKARLGARSLEDVDYDTMVVLIDTVVWLKSAFTEKTISNKRLLNMIFGARTEKAENVLGPDPQQSPADQPDARTSSDSTRPRPRRKGHGRRKADDFPGAVHIPVPNQDEGLREGALCPKCKDGGLYRQPPGKVLRFEGQPLIIVKVYEPDRVRCGMCGEVFTAHLPPEAGDKKYDETVGSMTALVKYGMGMPFYRLGRLQAYLGNYFPPSVQWEIVSTAAKTAVPAYGQLLLEAAQAEVLQNDDTPMKIMAYMEKGAVTEVNGRTGVQTSGIIASKGDHQFGLFFTGRNHAGENLGTLLEQRAEGSDTPTLMCDALRSNIPEGFTVKLANCNSHCRRKFYELVDIFPEEVRLVIDTYIAVYRHEAQAKGMGLTAMERLAYHQQHSGPLMEDMKKYLQDRLDQRLVEPNSSLGEAIGYLLRHWEPLTLFLREPGVPLDNNATERLLKVAILNRKNAYFYKTENGAAVGDIFMTLIYTCVLNDVNPFEYLTALLKHGDEVRANPSAWLPWNYEEALTALGPPKGG